MPHEAWRGDQHPEEGDGETLRVEFVTMGRFPIYWAVQPNDPEWPGCVIVATMFKEHRIAMRAWPNAEWFEMRERAATLFEGGVNLVYRGWEAPPGICADLVALVPASRLPSEALPGEAWETLPADAVVGVPLGRLVRYQQDRKHPGNLMVEAMDHLGAVLRGEAESLVDRALRHLG
jgi:hypothetical protein